MSDKPNGGPAFPVREAMFDKTQMGMTLRDYFAAKAMQGMLAYTIKSSPDAYASDAYAIADAMLKEREK